MTDIVERLRRTGMSGWLDAIHIGTDLELEAADEIERLRAENKRLQMLLMKGRSVHGGWPDVVPEGTPP